MTDDLAAALARAERAEAELERLRKPAGVTRPADNAPTFYRQDLADPAFFREHRAEIMRAAVAGRIVDDPNRPDWRVQSAPSRAARELAAARWTPKDGAK